MVAIALMGWVCSACGSSSDDSSNAGGTSNGSCPNVSGEWTLTDHCESAYIGMTLNVTQNACALSFAAPFDAFSGSVTSSGKITLSGPQSCTGTATSTSVSMSCTPDPCPVKLAR